MSSPKPSVYAPNLTITVPVPPTHPAGTLNATGDRDVVSGAKFLAILMNLTNHNQPNQTFVELNYTTPTWNATFNNLIAGDHYLLIVSIVPFSDPPVVTSCVFQAV
jgi:hypothetical protein